MKKSVFLLMGIAAMLTACENNMAEDYETSASKEVTFCVSGDFNKPEFNNMTRSLEADGKAMTDLWVLDYVDGALAQDPIHQTSENADFGSPTMTLAYGQHHVYFIASRGTSPTLSTSAHKITWAKAMDTFWLDYSINMTSNTLSAQSIVLNRVATKLTISVLDEIPTGTATIELTPATWYAGLDYLTGTPMDALTSEPRVINIPSSYIGTTGEVTASIFGISGTTEWTTDVTVTARNASSEVIGMATISDAPFVANRVTGYSGNLFANSGGFVPSLNTTWSDAYTGTW